MHAWSKQASELCKKFSQQLAEQVFWWGVLHFLLIDPWSWEYWRLKIIQNRKERERHWKKARELRKSHSAHTISNFELKVVLSHRHTDNIECCVVFSLFWFVRASFHWKITRWTSVVVCCLWWMGNKQHHVKQRVTTTTLFCSSKWSTMCDKSINEWMNEEINNRLHSSPHFLIRASTRTSFC